MSTCPRFEIKKVKLATLIWPLIFHDYEKLKCYIRTDNGAAYSLGYDVYMECNF